MYDLLGIFCMNKKFTGTFVVVIHIFLLSGDEWPPLNIIFFAEFHCPTEQIYIGTFVGIIHISLLSGDEWPPLNTIFFSELHRSTEQQAEHKHTSSQRAPPTR